ncbi:MAG: fructose-1,6-bisphosphatase [Dehalococcoidia bacterium]|nr:fructose-1,6-bisphosphatase [Dehalococcoidia bacterium]
MPQTLSVIKAGVGGFVGRSGTHPEVIEAAREALALAVQSGLLTDAQAHACGDDLFLVMAHGHGEDHEGVHRTAWETFEACTEVARRLHLYGAGQDVLTDAFAGSVRGTGIGSAELVLTERPSEPVVVFMADKTAVGAFNLPLVRTFADPFTTPGLVMAEPLHQGFAFEVHDLKHHRKVMFTTPEETYDLLAFVGATSQYAVKRIVSRATGEVAAVASTDRVADLAGRYAGNDDPTAIVRCHGAFPTVGEVLEPYTLPQLVVGGLRASHHGPWMPVGQEGAGTSRSDGPPRVVALGFQLAEGRLVGPRDLFADAAFEGARRQANEVADYLRRHGPFEPHRLPLEEMEHSTVPSVAARMASRWSDL